MQRASQLGPCAPAAVARRWLPTDATPSLEASASHRYLDLSVATASLQSYVSVQPSPFLHSSVYGPRVPFEYAREWGLARCGHHPCSDGRIARHRGQPPFPCPLCFGSVGDLAHWLLSCDGVDDLRATWRQRVGNSVANSVQTDMLILFAPAATVNTAGIMAAHVIFVGAVLLRLRAHLIA